MLRSIRRRPRTPFAVAAAGALVLLALVGPSSAIAADAAVQQVTGNLFSPANVTINVGDPAPAHTRHERVAAASPDDRYHAPGTSRG
jgi:hypothetical protein